MTTPDPAWWNLPARLRRWRQERHVRQTIDDSPELQALEQCESILDERGIKIDLTPEQANTLLAQAASAGADEFEEAVTWLERYCTGIDPKQVRVFRDRITRGVKGSRLADSVMASLNAESQRLRAMKTESARFAIRKKSR